MSQTTNGLTKLFPTGAMLLVQAANQVVINLGQGQPTVALSNLSLSLTQPFLQGGGFAVTLEPLTQAERTLLYAMRSYTRFRKVIYVSITTGGGLTNNPYGLPGLSENLGRGIGENLTAPTIGFLPILQSGAIVINNKKNVETLERYLRQYQAFREGGQLSDLQVGLVEVQMLNTRATLLGSVGTTGAPGSIRGYLDAIDNFKLQLGIPETVALDLDIGPLKPIHRQLTKYERIYADVREAEAQAHNFNVNEPVAVLRERWRKLLTGSGLVKGTNFSKKIGDRWDSLGKLSDDQLTEQLGKLREERSKLLDEKADRQLKGIPDPPEALRRIAELEYDIDLAFFERDVRNYEKQPWMKAPTADARHHWQSRRVSRYLQLVLPGDPGGSERTAGIGACGMAQVAPPSGVRDRCADRPTGRCLYGLHPGCIEHAPGPDGCTRTGRRCLAANRRGRKCVARRVQRPV